MKTVLIDDERLAREELRRLLAVHPEVKVVGDAANVTEALRMLPKVRPDLVFLDIEMPGRNGFDLLAALRPPHPEVVFVTAYDAFALRAFEVNALDYLLKPVNPTRLAETLARVHRRRERVVAGTAPEPAGANPDPRESGGAVFREDDRVFVRDGERCWFIPVKELVLLESEGNHTRLHFRGDRALVHRALKTLEDRLPKALFFRANRAQVVNRAAITKLEPWFGATLRATLASGQEVEFSRRQAQEFRERLGL